MTYLITLWIISAAISCWLLFCQFDELRISDLTIALMGGPLGTLVLLVEAAKLPDPILFRRRK
jgi:hypothetical protein